jgi:hypothetical protein
MVYGVMIDVDWGNNTWNYWWNDPVDSNKSGIRTGCSWISGRWNLLELEIVEYTLSHIDNSMNRKFSSFFQPITISKVGKTCGRGCTKSKGSLIELLDSGLLPTNHDMSKNIINGDINFDTFTITHEIGHAWDIQHNGDYH